MTTTLGQIEKILSYLHGVAMEQIQKVIESGDLASVIRTGDLSETTRKQQNEEKIRVLWNAIRRLSGYEGIVITVPRDPCKHIGKGTSFQVRCWKDKHGSPNPGHIDGGVDLFETYIPNALPDCDCCWQEALNRCGLDFYRNIPEGKKWVKETRTVEQGYVKFEYDVISLQNK